MSQASHLFSWRWQPQERPAEPRAAVGFGDVAIQLLRCINALPEEQRKHLQITAGDGLLIVTGKNGLLPWLDGVAYAAPQECAADLWLPTNWSLSLPAELIVQALKVRYGRQPLLLWRKPDVIVPLDKLLPVSQSHLNSVADKWRVSLS